MKVIGVLSVVLSFLVASSLSQSRQQCRVSRPSIQGECVLFSDCPLANNLPDFLTSDVFNEIKQRSTACRRGSFCCETSGSFIPTTATVTTPAPSTTPSPSRIDEDIESHPNYRFFKDLKCGTSFTDKISNGEDASMFEFPWAARLGYDYLDAIEYNCGGSLISEFYVLTAAHCLVYLPVTVKLVTVRLGDYDTNTEVDCIVDEDDPDETECTDPVQDIKVRSFVAHPGFKNTRASKFNDIGIVQLNEGANLKHNSIKPVCLPFANELQSLPNKFVVIGWGRTEKSARSAVLQKANLPFYDLGNCARKLSTKNRAIVLNDGQFCAGGEGKVDACRGDSGSAIQSFQSIGGKQKMVQYGVVSYGVATCGIEENYPGIYTKVSKYLGWILDNMQ